MARCTGARTTVTLLPTSQRDAQLLLEEDIWLRKGSDRRVRIVTRPKPITSKNEGVFHPAAVATERIEYGNLGLVDEFNFVARYARDHESVKVTMTGPHMLAKVAYDEYYDGDLRAIMLALAQVINQNLKELEQVGCKHIQLDEPLFAVVGSPGKR